MFISWLLILNWQYQEAPCNNANNSFKDCDTKDPFSPNASKFHVVATKFWESWSVFNFKDGGKGIFHRLGRNLVCTGPDDQSSFKASIKGHVQ
jgi:hypothetical protein